MMESGGRGNRKFISCISPIADGNFCAPSAVRLDCIFRIFFIAFAETSIRTHRVPLFSPIAIVCNNRALCIINPLRHLHGTGIRQTSVSYLLILTTLFPAHIFLTLRSIYWAYEKQQKYRHFSSPYSHTHLHSLALRAVFRAERPSIRMVRLLCSTAKVNSLRSIKLHIKKIEWWKWIEEERIKNQRILFFERQNTSMFCACVWVWVHERLPSSRRSFPFLSLSASNWTRRAAPSKETSQRVRNATSIRHIDFKTERQCINRFSLHVPKAQLGFALSCAVRANTFTWSTTAVVLLSSFRILKGSVREKDACTKTALNHRQVVCVTNESWTECVWAFFAAFRCSIWTGSSFAMTTFSIFFSPFPELHSFCVNDTRWHQDTDKCYTMWWYFICIISSPTETNDEWRWLQSCRCECEEKCV